MTSPDCAAVCVKALLAEHPKARYRITLPTQVFWYLKRLLPTCWLDAVQRAAVGGKGKTINFATLSAIVISKRLRFNKTLFFQTA